MQKSSKKQSRAPQPLSKATERFVHQALENRRMTDGQNAAAKKMQSVIHGASHVAVVNPPKQKAKKKKQNIVRQPRAIHPESDLGRWLHAVARPFDAPLGVKCPITYNPAPSYIQTTIRTTTTDLNVVLGPGSTYQYSFFPGRTRHWPNDSSADLGAGGMDAVSYHNRPQAVNVSANPDYDIVTMGPLIYSNTPGDATAMNCAAGVRRAVAFGAFEDGTAVAGVNALYWDVEAPYQVQTNDGHARWQLVAMGVRAVNNTQEASRGGNVVTVQPNSNGIVENVTLQSQLEKYPTFMTHGVGDQGVEVSWIPRPQDMAFSHTVVGAPRNGIVSTSSYGACMYLFLNNPTAANQNYAVQTVYHWQLAGNLVNGIGTHSPHQPALKSTVEPAVSYLMSTSPSAVQLPRVAQVVHSHDESSSEGLTSKLSQLASTARTIVNFAGKVVKI